MTGQQKPQPPDSGPAPIVDAAAVGTAETGHDDIDSAVLALDAAPTEDLDALVAAAEQVQRTLQARLRDLGDT